MLVPAWFTNSSDSRITDLVNPAFVTPGTGPMSGREMADVGGGGIVFLAGVPMGVEVAIGRPADCSTS